MSPHNHVTLLLLQESRVLKFWFAPDTDYLDKVTGAYEFFKELVKPDNFPRGEYSAPSRAQYVHCI